ncbi:MAG: tetratricopeptide repeat protein [Gallionella sp.]|nr:tetratricopeptide repeat protein [Gallionella sp.]
MNATKQIALWVALVGGLIAALYGQFLHNPIVFDDLYFFMLDGEGRSAIEAFAAPSMGDLRALPYATLAWTAQWFGFGLLPFRIENMLLHWMVVVVLALFVVRLYHRVLPSAGSDGERTGMVAAVLISVTLFALHPLAVYATGYLVQRTMVMATLFSVLALWSYLHGSNGHSKTWLWVSVLLYFMATHSKEHVIMLPAVVVALTVLLHQDWRRFLRENWPVFLGYALVALLTIAQIRGVIGHTYELNAGEMLEGVQPENAYGYSVLTQSWLFFKYGVLWLLPNPGWMSVDMREPFAQGFLSAYGAALLAYLLYGFAALRLLVKRGRTGLIGFAMLLPWLMFMTEFSSVRVQEIFVLYRSYIWALGGVIVLPLLLMQLNARLMIGLSLLFAATLFMISMERLSSFSHPILLWDDAEKLVKDRQTLPGAARIYYNRGTEWLKVDEYDSALADLVIATRLSPQLSAAFGNLGAVYLKTGQNELAIQAYSRAIALDSEQKAPTSFKYYSGRAGAFEATGQQLKAAIDYKVTCLLARKGCDKTSLPSGR